VSHLKQRKEKTCLNCNAAIHGRYCNICGQENVEPQESVWHLIVHFFNDITHFDGKFFSSVKYVITKPGFLSSEYMAGRRMSYLNPVRFYVFTSALFFFLLFTFFRKANSEKDNSSKKEIFSKKDSLKLITKAENIGMDSVDIILLLKNHGIDSLQQLIKNDASGKNSNGLTFSDAYRDRKQFDSLDKIGKVKDNFFERKMIEKQFQLQEKYGKNSERGKDDLLEIAIHLIPQMLFLSLPFFALLLQLLYVRRKKYYYVAHLIFTIHFYIFVYMQILIINFTSKIAELSHQKWLSRIAILLGLSILFYMYKAMRNFYEQNRFKTILKLFILFFGLLFLSIFFMILLLGFTLYKI
jgi:hypothetical protein